MKKWVGTHLDLFSGIGGFALAARRSGWKTIGFCENERSAKKILAKNFPKIPIFDDIKNMRGIKADLVTGGFPCQPFSFVGQRRGQADDRWLWPEMLRIIQESQPAWVVGENVAGFINMGLETVLSDLEKIGFEAQALVIPASAVQAHQGRNRVWILAWNTTRIAREYWVRARKSHTKPKREIRCPPMPLLHRAPHGLSRKMDRLRGLGNAIVPQVAEVILSEMARIH